MSVGVFLSIHESYPDNYREYATSLLNAVNVVLSRLGHNPLIDSGKGPHVCEGRTSLDHIGGGSFRCVGELAGSERQHAHLLWVNPYRVVFAPASFDEPQATNHQECFGAQEIPVLLGSSPRLRDQLLSLAPEIGIPLENGVLTDEVAQKIDDMQPLHDGEDDWDLIENIRMGWLVMHEAALISIARQVPICLAG